MYTLKLLNVQNSKKFFNNAYTKPLKNRQYRRPFSCQTNHTDGVIYKSTNFFKFV